MKRSLIAFQALLACSAVFCQSSDAAVVFNQPDPANNGLERRIESARNGDWSNLLRPAELEGEQLAKSTWKNGGGHKFKNSRGSGTWKNGSGGGKWSNSRPAWGNGRYHGGWGNGASVGFRNGGGFINW
ncbi:MAG: GrrA/OscA1 family cyclophane-containing rSAM-modified RiPP [Prochlorococcaceae cyanobacterium]